MFVAQENITDLIKSHSSIKDIWSGLGAAQKQLTNISAQFDGYKRVLDSTASSFEQIEQKNNRMGVITKNQNTLLTELDDLLRKITLDRGTVNVLENSTFDGGKALEETIRAASGLDKVLKSDLESGMVIVQYF
jgi:DNA repair ATPase RecN